MATLTMNRANLKEKLIYGSAYTSFFVFAFMLGVYFTFPYDRLRDFIVSKVSSDAGPDALTLKIGELSPSWLTGVSLTNVDVSKPGVGTDAAATLHFDAVTLRASPLSLLFGSVKVALAAEVGDGSMDVKYAQGDTSKEIEAELDALDVKELGLGAWIGVPMSGKASGTVDLVLDDDPTKSNGDLALKVEGLRIGDGKSKLAVPGMNGGMTIDEIDAGTLDFVLKVTDGVADVERFAANGRDLKLDGDGTVRLANPVRRARIDLLLDLKFNDAYKNKSDRSKAMFEIMGNQPEWKRASDADGTMHLHVGGTMQALRAAPGTGGATRAARTSVSRKRPRNSNSVVGAAKGAADEPAAQEP